MLFSQAVEPPLDSTAIEQAAGRLAKLLETPKEELHLREPAEMPRGADAVIDAGPFSFIVEWKRSSSAGPVSAAIDQVRHYAAQIAEDLVPLVVVPYMGEVGRKLCAEAGIAWLDLSGNAAILAPGLRILVDGKPNRFKRRGRPSTAFAPKSSRIARWLLLHAPQPMSQRQIARSTDMDEGFTSRIVARLIDDGLAVRDPKGSIRPRDPDLLLDAWSEDYEFSKHQVLRGHVPARSGDELLNRLTEQLRDLEVDHAATGLAAAWHLTRFAGFRIVSLYLSKEPVPELLSEMSFRPDPRGANVWLVVPNDEGVFHGSQVEDGLRCVHPVQIYLDLKDHPERAEEAAEHLRTRLLKWSADV